MRPLLCFIVLIFSVNNIFAQCPTPNGLNTTNITYYNALANWNPVSGVNRYKIQYRIFGTSTWSNLSNIDSLQVSRTLPQLQQGTTYEWHIKAFCDSTSQNGSAWSYTDTFTTNVFVPAQFNPIINSTISSYNCNTAVDLRLVVSQQANEPDIGETTLETNGGYFDISNFIASTNINDVFPKYLSHKVFIPKPSIETLSNAMDVGNPSNIQRINAIYKGSVSKINQEISSWSYSDNQTLEALKSVYDSCGYILDPHGAVGYLGAMSYIKNFGSGSKVVVLGTAHPSKFIDSIEALDISVPIPEKVKEVLKKKKLAVSMTTTYSDFKDYMLNR